MPKLFGQFFRKVILFIILAELFSLFSFLLPEFGIFAFWTIIILFLIISLYKIEWGLYILLVELFIGSKGYLFFYEYAGVAVSIRIAFFIIFLSVWLASMMNREKRQKLANKLKPNKKIINYYLLIIIVIAIGIITGFLRNYSFQNIFFDFNGWLYFALFIPFLDIINLEKIKRTFQLFIASVIWTASKTIICLYIFSHQYFNVRPFYKWLRETGVGEITVMDGGFSRIFFQSQIFVLIGIFVIGVILVDKLINKEKVNKLFQPMAGPPALPDASRGRPLAEIISYQLLLTTIIISLSRSFWVGLLVALGAMFIDLIFKEKIKTKDLLKITAGLLISIAISVALIFAIVKIPPAAGDISGSMFEKRLTDTGEVAGSSRINQLKPLFIGITKHPVLGSGFGATITYQSEDPRIKTDLNPEGWYTTYAFEWGYLDILLKLGILGLAVYLYFIYLIVKLGTKIINYQLLIIKNKILTLGLLLGIIVLLTTNIFSPYLNHPLGIGYILLCGAIFTCLKNEFNCSRK